jgi:flagellar protein FliS
MDARLSYRQAATRGARPLQLVILLYQQGIDDLRRALTALRKNDVEARTREINHALQVIGQLQGTLDREEGGPVAATLDRFYDQVRAGLVEAQFQQSAAALEEQISHLTLVHEAWCEADRSTAASAHRPAPSKLPAEDEPRSFAEWNA